MNDWPTKMKKYKAIMDFDGDYTIYRKTFGPFWKEIGFAYSLEGVKDKVERDKAKRSFRPKVIYFD